MILTATKYSDVQTSGRRPPPKRAARAPQVFVPTLTGAAKCLQEWYWRELKEGGFLFEYLATEKRKMPHMIRRMARVMDGFKQNTKSDFQRLAGIPKRLYHRWKTEDEHFFDDNENLRSLKRDNPDLPVFVGPRQLPPSRFRKRYPSQNAESGKTKPRA